MYSKTNIGKLSKAQISKLLKGHRVRVKSGTGHEISLSKEQHKKLTRAHKKVWVLLFNLILIKLI